MTGADVDANALRDDNDFKGFGELKDLETFVEVQDDDEEIIGSDSVPMCGQCEDEQDVAMMPDECLTAEFFYHHDS